jgi:hypothetical protein
MYTGDQSWVENLKKPGLSEIGIRKEEAKIKFDTGVVVLGTDHQYQLIESNNLHVLSRESTCLEVIAIQAPTDETKATYDEFSKDVERKVEPPQPLGKLICKTWHIEDYDEHDLPKDDVKYPGGKPRCLNAGTEYEFWIEDSILQDCFVGMKMEANILNLNGGLTILDDVIEAMCSFFTWIPNELWMERKPKEVRWLKKGMGLDDDEDAEFGDDKKADKGASDNEFDDD